MIEMNNSKPNGIQTTDCQHCENTEQQSYQLSYRATELQTERQTTDHHKMTAANKCAKTFVGTIVLIVYLQS